MISWPDFAVGGHTRDCIVCEGRKKLGITINPDGSGVAHCHKCHFVETYRGSSSRRSGPVRSTVRPLVPQTLSQLGQELFASCTGLRGTTGERYLMARNCALPPDDGDLRYHPNLRHFSGYTGPALVALVTHAVTRVPMTLHRTWIRSDGKKADVDPPRMLLGGHRKAGGVIRLWPDECVTHSLGIAEGIETALTLATVLKPAWSLIDAGNLAALPALAGIEVLTIAADHDEAGLKAATACATRWTAAGCDVRIVIPPRARTDLNDFAREAV